MWGFFLPNNKMNILQNLSPEKPLVMGILNVTPDSFSDGGILFSDSGLKLDSVLARAEKMIEQGADILDVGGESTRPGALRPTSDEELERVIPVVELLRKNFDVYISVDTSSPQVMKEAINVGAKLINDVRALTEPEALTVVAEAQVEVCLMHMQGTPDSMQRSPEYKDVVQEVVEFLRSRTQICIESGIDKNKICVDPGFGFGKSFQHNMLLMANLHRFKGLDLPLLIGVSRKGMIGEITGKSIDQRLIGSVAMAQVALASGASILRVHDVAETCDMIKVWSAVQKVSADS